MLLISQSKMLSNVHRLLIFIIWHSELALYTHHTHKYFCLKILLYKSCDFLRIFSWFHNFFYKSPFASKSSWKKSSHQGKKEVACIVSQTSRRFRGALSSRPKGDPGLLPIFQDFCLLLSNCTPDAQFCNEIISWRFCLPLSLQWQKMLMSFTEAKS